MEKLLLKKIKILIGIILSSIIGVWGLYYLNNTYGIGLICAFHKITGLHCPGCGMTRAVFSILRLDFCQAIRYNLFSLLVLPIMMAYFIGGIYAWLFNKNNFMDKKIPSAIWVIFIIAMLIYGILRNFPQFSYLAPTII